MQVSDSETADARPVCSGALAAMQVASRLWIVWGIIVPVQGETITGAIKLAQVGQAPYFQASRLLAGWAVYAGMAGKECVSLLCGHWVLV